MQQRWCLPVVVVVVVMVLVVGFLATTLAAVDTVRSSSAATTTFSTTLDGVLTTSTETTTTTMSPTSTSHRSHHRHQPSYHQHKVHKVTDVDLIETSVDSPLLPTTDAIDARLPMSMSMSKTPVTQTRRANKLQRQEQKQSKEQQQQQQQQQQQNQQQSSSSTTTTMTGDQRLPPYVASNCSRCRMLEETINLTKEAIKQQILSKLGLRQPPNITGRALPRIPPLNHLLDMYGMQSDAATASATSGGNGNLHAFKPGPVFEEAEDDYHAKTEKVISFAQQPPKSWSLPANMEVQYFKFSHSVMANKVIRANLWVYLTPFKALQHDVGTLMHVYKVSRTESSGGTVMTHVLSSKVNDVKLRRGGWVAVDIRKLAFEWFRHPYSNLGIVVQAFDQEGLQLVAHGRGSESDASLVPFVEVYTMDESKRRTKRMIGLNCEENSHEVRCCRYPLTVDFEEFGWDWIIAPKKYEANYCSGECPFVFLQKYPHTHLVQHANPSGSAGPCCAPRKMSPISMLYFDNEYNIIYGLLPGMVVDRCSCS